MATKKGGAKKGTAKKGGAKKGGAKKGGQTRGLLSNIGTIASTVGAVAGSFGSKKELRVSVGRNAGINEVIRATKEAFARAGHPGCKSGFEKITFDDRVLPGG
ncbi:MAG TPA: hypothetical protein VK619_15020 [Pyrinomonadaceae bacterium]|nr:hypothetical protein [Pyrinomonadaceae bacterium]